VPWLRREGDAQPPGDARDPVPLPTLAKRNSDRDNVRPLPPWDAIEIAHELGEEVVRKEFRHDQFHQVARPCEFRGAGGEEPHRTRTKLVPPPLGIELLFRPSGVFELTIDVEPETELAHGCTSTNAGAPIWAPVVRVGLGRPASVM
jgi:hypothetical protein